MAKPFFQILIFAIGSVWLGKVHAQHSNLVSNGSFDVTGPDYMYERGQDGREFEKIATPWFTPKGQNNTPDVITPKFKTDLGQSFFLHTGDDSFIGLAMGGSIGGEFISTKLQSYLKKDTQYLISFKIGVPQKYHDSYWNGRVLEGVGFYFSKKQPNFPENSRPKAVPQVLIPNRRLSPEKWMEINAIFTPHEDSLNFVSFGIYEPLNFNRVATIKHFYYFLDSFSIRLWNGEPFHKMNDPIPENSWTPTNFSIFFDQGDTIPEKTHLRKIDTLVRFLNTDQGHFDVWLVGYADRKGNANKNTKLSLQRAQFLRNYMVAAGISSDTDIQILGKGENKIETDTNKSNALSRRVDVLVTPKKDTVNANFPAMHPSNNRNSDAKMGKPIYDFYYSLLTKEKDIREQLEDSGYDPEVVNNLGQFQPTPAIAQISRMARKAEIVMVNEAHNSFSADKHREFMQFLLDSLYQMGFRHLGLEMLFNDGTELNKRKYPITSDGYYVREPSAGNLIRHALSLGFNIFGYEPNQLELEIQKMEVGYFDTTFLNLGDEEQNMYCRDLLQAKKIVDYGSKNKGKLVIFCGYAHNTEVSIGTWNPLACVMREKFGLNPLTIDQITLDLDICPFEFKKQLDKISEEPGILLDSENVPFVINQYDPDTKKYLKRTDVQVIQPTKNKTRNLSVQSQSNNIKSYPIKTILNRVAWSENSLLLAFPEGANLWSDIPIDAIALNEKTNLNLLFKKGKYVLYLIDNQGKYKSIKFDTENIDYH